MTDETAYRQHNAQYGSGDVRPTQEGLFAANPGNGRDNNRLSPRELFDRII